MLLMVIYQYFPLTLYWNIVLWPLFSAAWLAHLDEHRTSVWEAGVQDPGRTHTQGLKTTEENVLPLLWHLQAVRHSSLLG